MSLKYNKHKEIMDEVFENPKFKDAVNVWFSFFMDKRDKMVYSNWRYLNIKRQTIENYIFKKFIKSKFKVLDIGCSDGFFLRRIYTNLGDKVEYYGVDISEKAINLAKENFKIAKYVVSPGENLPFDNSTFDFIQIITTLEHVISPRKVLKEAFRVLKKGGFLYIVIHKKSLDPLILTSVIDIIDNFIKKLLSRRSKILNKYQLSLEFVRKELDKIIKELKLKLVEKNFFVSHINIKFYRRFKLPMFFLMKISELTNNLSIQLFKNLEYRIYRK